VGAIGEVHARVIEGLAGAAAVTVVMGRDPDRTAAAGRLHGADPSLSVEDTLAREDIDAVAICTPSATHADIAVRALRAGKHVVVEKPLDIALPSALRVVDEQRRSGRTVTVISQHRFDPASAAVHEAIRRGGLGRLTSAVMTMPWWRSQAYYDSADWRGTRAMDGGGALLNQGIHAIDLLVWFMGLPTEVFAWTDRLAHERIEVEDTAVATLRFAGGALGVIHGATSAHPGLDTRLQIHGDRGSAVIQADQLAYLHCWDDPGSGAAEQVGAPSMEGSLRAQYQDFLSAVQRGHQPLVTAEVAASSLSVVDAIYRSAARGLPVGLGPSTQGRAEVPE
jgi:predicted dehydrogenase